MGTCNQAGLQAAPMPLPALPRTRCWLHYHGDTVFVAAPTGLSNSLNCSLNTAQPITTSALPAALRWQCASPAWNAWTG